MSEKLSILRSKKVFGTAMGLGLILSVASCSSGEKPEKITDCTPRQATGDVARLDSGGSDDPDVILNYAKDHDYQDETADNVLTLHYITGIGEIVCKTTSEDNGAITLHFIPENNQARQDYIDSSQNVLDHVRQQTSTTVN